MAKEIETTTQEVANKFKLLKVGNFQTVVQITKTEHVVIDHSAKVAQDLLKKVYDAGAQYQKMIQAPTDYKAPWQQ